MQYFQEFDGMILPKMTEPEFDALNWHYARRGWTGFLIEHIRTHIEAREDSLTRIIVGLGVAQYRVSLDKRMREIDTDSPDAIY